MWVRFLRRYDFNPPERYGRSTITYQAGALVLVRRVCALEAIALGAAELAARPLREAL